MHAVKGFLHSLKIGLYIRALGLLIQFLTKGPIKVLLDIKKSPLDYLRFPAFLALQSFLYKIGLCLMRKLKKREDPLNSLIAGILSGLSLSIIKD